MNVIKIEGEIGWNITSKEVQNKIADMSGDIEVHVNSVGGSVYQGIEIFNAIFDYNKGLVTTVNKGMAASISSYIMLAGDKIKAYSNSTNMIHNALTFAYGNHHELRDTANILESLSDVISNMYADKTGKSKKEIKEMMDKETHLFGKEMLDEGFVDEIIPVEKTPPKDIAIGLIKNEFKACTASSKEHCKIEGYNGDIKNLVESLVSIPTEHKADKIENSKTGVDMSISKEEFDAIKSKADALEVSMKEKDDALASALSDVEAVKASQSRAEIIAFCGANRNIISMKKEQEFLAKNAELSEVMSFAMAEMENDPAENIDGKQKGDEANSIIADAIAKQNKGEL